MWSSSSRPGKARAWATVSVVFSHGASGPTSKDRRGPNRTRIAWLTTVAGLVAIITGCADQDEQTLCGAYSEYLAVADDVYAADPSAATADDATETAEILLGELAQLRAVSDSRYRAPIDELRALLADFENTLDSVTDAADYDTWRPLVDETLDDIRIADTRLRRVIDPACAAVFSGGDV